MRAVSPSLYSTLGIRCCRGRLFSDSDGPQAAAVAVVNQALVKKYFRGQNPLGQQLKISDKGPHGTLTIIGVVENTHQTAMSDDVQPEIDVSYRQLGPTDELTPYILASFTNLALRTQVAPTAVIPSLRTTLREFDPDMAVMDIRTMQDVVDTSLGSQTLAVRLLWIFAGVGAADFDRRNLRLAGLQREPAHPRYRVAHGVGSDPLQRDSDGVAACGTVARDRGCYRRCGGNLGGKRVAQLPLWRGALRRLDDIAVSLLLLACGLLRQLHPGAPRLAHRSH